MYSADDPWGENALLRADEPPLKAHAILCAVSAFVFGIYFLLSVFVDGAQVGQAGWLLLTVYFVWRSITYFQELNADLD